ncbi:serine/threonine-protein kinase MRCK alpha-like [Balaenoptera acutorostrata]|uniref:Serine/threonine-protein kinase MRCK alpha-like n=1 Tax=Balaenoptera acutorostrata TaxID=9767 RepID=A0ABM3TQE0_BALAC|nr:serine/threonine-protein kinase MRCK alpha-like [Balaenoptera acutorostrata]
MVNLEAATTAAALRTCNFCQRSQTIISPTIISLYFPQKACGFSCHTTCVEKAPKTCPVPFHQKKGAFCLDSQKGMGTAYEGHVWIPKKAGMKKGWQRALAVVCDFKLFLYDMDEEEDSTPNVVVSQVIDMRDGAFSVSSVWPSDFIPARRKEMPRMFKVTASQLSAPSNRYSIPILADSENEKSEWVSVLSELHKILRKSHSGDRSVYVLKEAYDNNLPLIKTTQTAAIIDHKRIALGNEEGLFVVHVTIDEIIRIGYMKKIHQIELIPHGQMVAVISGRSHHVQLFPMSALDGRKTDIHKLAETKGCQTVTSGTVCQGAHTCLCVARKSQIFCYKLFQSKKISHRKFKELQIPTNVQWMGIFSEQLCVGFQSGFLRYPLRRERIPYRMLHSHDPTLSFIAHQPVDALCAIEISSIEYLLCFKSIGIYTDSRGLRSRPAELMWPATPSYCYSLSEMRGRLIFGLSYTEPRASHDQAPPPKGAAPISSGLSASHVTHRVLVLRPGVRPVPLRWESRVQDIGPPETSWLHIISNSESSPRDLHLDAKTQLHSKTSKLQCWTPYAKQLARQEHNPTH